LTAACHASQTPASSNPPSALRVNITAIDRRADRVDFRPRIAAIRDGRHDDPVEDVSEHAPDGSEVTKWTPDENSQMWSRVAAP